MDLFSISQLQQFSGIKAHTIRIWEQRYGALKPSRSEGNTRYYDNSQLRRLLNIVSLMNLDHKVSELCRMPDEKLFTLLEIFNKESNPIDEASDYNVSQLISAGMSFDESHFEKMFSNCLLRFGMKDTYVKVIYPMLNRIGLMWQSDSMPPAAEHYISNLIRQKLFTSIDSLPPARSARSSWLLFLPEYEFHEVGLLFANYLIRQAGKKVFYLGSNVPLATLKTAVQTCAPQNLLFFTVHNNMASFNNDYLITLKKLFPSATIHVAGNEKTISQLSPIKQIHFHTSVESLENAIIK